MRTLVHISDTHILPTADDRLYGVDTLRNVQDVLQYVVDSGMRPDALVVSGDLADGGETESYRRLRHELDTFAEQLGADLVVAVGNHDLRPAFRQAMLDGPPTAEPVEYVRWIGGLRVIVLDSTVPGATYGEVRLQQLEWLASELRTKADEGSVLVMHHPPVPDPGPLAGLFSLHGAEKLESVVRGSDVVAVLAGHVHHPIASALGGAFCYAAPAVAYTLDPLQLANCILRGVQGAGFGVVRVFDGRAVAFTVSMPSSGEEIYRRDLSSRELKRQGGEATVAG